MLIDTHCHLDFPDFEAERDELVARAEAAGVRQMITISTQVHKFERIKAVAEAYPNVFCSVGTHPNHAHEEDIETEELVRLSEYEKCVAIGEVGLDYFYDYATPEQQAKGLRKHIAAARITGLPMVIHARAADDDMAAILRDEHEKGGAFPSGTKPGRVLFPSCCIASRPVPAWLQPASNSAATCPFRAS